MPFPGQAPYGLPSAFQPTGSFSYTNPASPPPAQSGGNWIWDAAKGVWNFIKGNAGDILQTGAGLVEGYMSSADRAKQLAELQRQFDANLKQRQEEFGRTQGDTEAQAAVRAQTQLNAAPIADKAQALILARMGVSPGQFQPRDYTKGVSDLSRPSAAPGANVASALQTAATNYKPGQGGVDTSAIRMLLDKMKAGGFGSTGTTPHPPVQSTPPTRMGTLPELPVPSDRATDDDTPTSAGILRQRLGIR